MQKKNNEYLIDVVEDFEAPNQTKGFREAFRQWRRQENPYAFHVTQNPKETSFSESKVMTGTSPAKTEQGVLYRLSYLIGCLLILYLMIENILDKIIVSIMHAMGMHIQLLFWGSDLYGDERNVFLVIVLINTLKYLLPVLLLHYFLRMPLRVSMPTPITNPQELLFGIVMTMMLSVGCGLFSVTNSDELDKYKLICNAVGVDDKRMLLYTLFTVLIMPILIELLLHGAMFQVLRQFGDTFAIAAVTFLAAIIMHSVQDVLRIAIMTLAFSYFVIRTGSFWTAVILHIVHEIYMFVLFYIETFESVFTPLWWVMMLMPCIVGILTGAYMLFHEPETERTVPKNETFLKFSDKCRTFISSLPIIGLIVICVMLVVISTVFAL